MVMGDVLCECATEMAFADRDDPIEAFGLNRSYGHPDHEALDLGVYHATASAYPRGPFPRDELPMPTQQRVGRRYVYVKTGAGARA